MRVSYKNTVCRRLRTPDQCSAEREIAWYFEQGKSKGKKPKHDLLKRFLIECGRGTHPEFSEEIIQELRELSEKLNEELDEELNARRLRFRNPNFKPKSGVFPST